MNSTTNHGLSLPSYSDWADVAVLDDNFNSIDNGLLPFIDSENTSTNNLYKIDTGLNKTLLKNGFGFRTVIHKDSTGNCYFKIDDINVNIPILDQKGNPFKKLKNNGVYAFTYYNGNFILISGGGCSDSDLVTAIESDVLENKTYIGSDEEIHTGTAPAIEEKTWIPTTVDQTIKKGGHLVGDQIIKGDANLIASNIVEGKSLFGVAGSATVESLGGKRFASGTFTGYFSPIECGFKASFVIFINESTGNALYYYNRKTYWAYYTAGASTDSPNCAITVTNTGISYSAFGSSSQWRYFFESDKTYTWFAIE